MATSENIAFLPAFDSADMFRASEKNLGEITALIRRELGETATVDYLKWWYFANPSRLFSILTFRQAGRISGMSAINGFQFKIGSENKMVGMIEKALVERTLRGNGLYTALCFESEKDCLRQGADGFIAFPKAASPSTPIFLNKCGFIRGISPDLLLIPFNPLNLFRGNSYRLVNSVNEAFFSRGILQFNNSVHKDYPYLLWRYLTLNPEQYAVLEVLDSGSGIVGYVFLKRIEKRGVPLYLLMDISVRSTDDIQGVLRQANLFCSRRASTCLLLFDNSDFDAALKGTFFRRIKNRFCFVVKGKDVNASMLLAKTQFNFFFGDLDFV